MSFSANAWKQIKNISVDNLIAGLLRDGFVLDMKVKTERIYRHPDGRRISIHYHTGSATYGVKLLKYLLEDTGWKESDLKRLKLIK